MSKKSPVKKISKGLAGAIAIASGTSAYGAGVYINPPADLTNVPGGTSTFRNWDVNGDGVTDFVFQNRYPNAPPDDFGVIWQLSMNPAAGTELTNGLLSYPGQFVQYAHALGMYRFISSFNTAFSTQTQVVLGSKYNYGPAGSFYYGGFAADRGHNEPYESVAPGTLAFVGFRFHAADGTHYGWVRLSVNAGIIDFNLAAYNTTANQEIATVIPEPGTLALLAVGAVGVIGAVAKRRRA